MRIPRLLFPISLLSSTPSRSVPATTATNAGYWTISLGGGSSTSGLVWYDLYSTYSGTPDTEVHCTFVREVGGGSKTDYPRNSVGSSSSATGKGRFSGTGAGKRKQADKVELLCDEMLVGSTGAITSNHTTFVYSWNGEAGVQSMSTHCRRRRLSFLFLLFSFSSLTPLWKLTAFLLLRYHDPPDGRNHNRRGQPGAQSHRERGRRVHLRPGL